MKIYIKDNIHLFRYNLSKILSILPKENFIQSHRSYIINKNFIDQIGHNYILINEHKIPLSPERKKILEKTLRYL